MPEKATGVNADESAQDADPCGAILIYATFPGPAIAERIASELVGARLAACVNIIPGMRSIYRWQGAVHRDEEVVAIIKTRAARAARVIGWVRASHPCANPALLALPVLGGSVDFLGWIASETGDDAGGL